MRSSSNTPETGWTRALAGKFIVFDGPDGSGKSTQFRRLSDLCRGAGVALTEVREPGGTHVGERIRHALLEHSGEEMSVVCEMLLYMASRAQLVEQKITPALERGDLVLADRFVSSTLAYQGAAGDIPIRDIEQVAEIAVQGVEPDLVVVFDVDDKTAAGRLNPLMDRMEAKGGAFHRRVREGYLEQAEGRPDQYAVIDAASSEEVVWANLCQTLRTRLAPGGAQSAARRA